MLIMGKLGVLVTAALATYQILNAENKVKETARQGIVIGGGAAGGFLQAWESARFAALVRPSAQ